MLERILKDWRDKGVSAPEQHMLVTELGLHKARNSPALMMENLSTVLETRREIRDTTT